MIQALQYKTRCTDVQQSKRDIPKLKLNNRLVQELLDTVLPLTNMNVKQMESMINKIYESKYFAGEETSTPRIIIDFLLSAAGQLAEEAVEKKSHELSEVALRGCETGLRFMRQVLRSLNELGKGPYPEELVIAISRFYSSAIDITHYLSTNTDSEHRLQSERDIESAQQLAQMAKRVYTAFRKFDKCGK